MSQTGVLPEWVEKYNCWMRKDAYLHETVEAIVKKTLCKDSWKRAVRDTLLKRDSLTKDFLTSSMKSSFAENWIVTMQHRYLGKLR